MPPGQQTLVTKVRRCSSVCAALILGLARHHAVPLPQRLGADAAYFLGLVHFYGDGAVMDMEKAIKYFRIAAQHGHVEAQVVMGHMLQRGLGASVDIGAAYAYYMMAHNAGNAHGSLGAGELLFTGQKTLPGDADVSLNHAYEVREAGCQAGFVAGHWLSLLPPP